MSNAKFFGILAVIVVAIIGGALLFTGGNDKKDDVKPANVAAVSESDFTKGSAEAKVTLIEYGDYQCPYCGIVHPIVEEVLSEYDDRVRFVFRHFPITSIHPNALVAHKAAEAAGNQDKFWEMHNKIYESQATWSSNNEAIKVFEGFAKDLKLDVDKFKKDFEDSETLNNINDMKAAGSAAGVESTPTFFLNGKKITSPRSADELKKELDKALADTK